MKMKSLKNLEKVRK